MTQLIAELSDAILTAALREAGTHGLRLSIAVVDASGILNRFVRMDGVHTGTVEVSVAKARSAALFRRSGKDFAGMLANGAQALLTVPNLLPVDGGEPLLSGEIMLGGIGVSGASPDLDGAVARAGAAAATGGGT